MHEMNVLIVSSDDCLITAHHAYIVISCWVWKCHHPLHHLWIYKYKYTLNAFKDLKLGPEYKAAGGGGWTLKKTIEMKMKIKTFGVIRSSNKVYVHRCIPAIIKTNTGDLAGEKVTCKFTWSKLFNVFPIFLPEHQNGQKWPPIVMCWHIL